jgi:hypothetical protein
MKGDIGFVGFMLTADEWKALDTEARAALIAVATRRADPWLPSIEPLAEGSGPMEIEEITDAELEAVDAPDALGMLEALAADALTREDPFAGIDDVPLSCASDRVA